MPAALSPTIRRDYRIDILRGLAILSVLVLHFNLSYRLLEGPLSRLLPGPYLSNLVWNGNYGVTVFFVISGYLITSTSLRRFGSLGAISPTKFYVFRFARIMPCLALVLAIITGLAIAGVSIFRDTQHVPLWIADLSVLTFWHNLLMYQYGYFNYCLNIFWSLSVEEVFYLAFPLLCLTLKRTRWLIPIWLIAIIVGPIYRSFNNQDEIRFLYGYLACFDAIAMGSCIALIVTRTRLTTRHRRILQLASLLWMLFIFLHRGIDATPVWGTTLMAAGAALFLFAEGASPRQTPSKRLRFTAPIAWLGRHSYELYLFHIVLLAGMRSLPWNFRAMGATGKLSWLLAFLAGSSLVAWLIARFYSEPMNRRLRTMLAPNPETPA